MKWIHKKVEKEKERERERERVTTTKKDAKDQNQTKSVRVSSCYSLANSTHKQTSWLENTVKQTDRQTAFETKNDNWEDSPWLTLSSGTSSGQSVMRNGNGLVLCQQSLSALSWFHWYCCLLLLLLTASSVASFGDKNDDAWVRWTRCSARMGRLF